jgi:hypothetical protein
MNQLPKQMADSMVIGRPQIPGLRSDVAQLERKGGVVDGIVKGVAGFLGPGMTETEPEKII